MARNTAEWVRRSAARRPDARAIVTGERGYSWAQLDADVDAAAAGLLRSGLEPGDRIAFLLGNTYEFVVAYFATLRARLVAVPLNPAYTSTEVAALVADAGARMLLVQPATQTLGEQAVDSLADLARCEVVNVLGSQWARIVRGGRSGPLPRWLAEALDRGEVADDELAVLMFTAGTSGKPKAAMLTHQALTANVGALLALTDPPAVSDADVVLAVLPMFHIYGLNTVLGLAVAAGATSVLVDRFDPRECLELISAEHVTTVAGAPAMFQAWCALHDGVAEAMKDVRLLSSGGSPLPIAVFDAFLRLSGHAVFEGYGMTETAPVVATTLVTGTPKPGSVGRALPGLDVRLVDETGADVDDGDPGEIWVRGASVFRGYWPDAAGGPDEDGWFRSGDVAFADEDGDLHLVDRRRELILVRGFNVYPREIEMVIEQLPGVGEVAVVGVADDATGEAVRAYVVPTDDSPGEALTEEIVLSFCATRLARFKCPTTVTLVDELPHSATGKVAKGRLREVHGDPEREDRRGPGWIGTVTAPVPAAASRVVLIGKPGCHLCDNAREVVREVCRRRGTSWTELSIADDPELYDLYSESIPVVLVDGAVHDFWRVDAARLDAALV